MATHTAWFTTTDITSIAGAMGVTFSTTVGTAIQQWTIDSVIENINTRTRRTWIPTTATRYFNGNDSGQLYIDEFVTISTVEFMGYLGTQVALALSNVIAVERANFPNDRIQIFRGSLPGFFNLFVDKFPAGRSNIKINALWGYGTTIPNDLWFGGLLQASFVLLNLSRFETDGFTVKWQEADVTEVNQFNDPFTFFKTGTTYEGLIKTYKRPSSQYSRQQRKQLV